MVGSWLSSAWHLGDPVSFHLVLSVTLIISSGRDRRKKVSLLPESLGPKVIDITSVLSPLLRRAHQATAGWKQELEDGPAAKPLPRCDCIPEKDNQRLGDS